MVQNQVSSDQQYIIDSINVNKKVLDGIIFYFVRECETAIKIILKWSNYSQRSYFFFYCECKYTQGW